MFTCRDGKGGELSSQASKMLYKPPGAVYIASYKVPLDQSDRWKLFVQFWNYTKLLSKRIIINKVQFRSVHLSTNESARSGSVNLKITVGMGLEPRLSRYLEVSSKKTRVD